MADTPVLTDAFTRGADESLSTSADWDQVNFYYGDASVTSATGRVDVGRASAVCLNRASAAHDADQYVKADMKQPTGYNPNASGLWIRVTGTLSGGGVDTVEGYSIHLIGDGSLDLVKWSSGTETSLWTNSDGWTDGDTMRLEATGTNPTTLNVYRNGTLYDSGSGYTAQDSTSPFTTGTPGLHLWYQGASWIDNWESGNITTADTTPPTTTAGPTVSSVTTTTASLSQTIDEDGKIYAVVVPSADSNPSVAQVKAGQDSTGTAAVWSANQVAVADTPEVFSITGLSQGTSYKVVSVAEDDEATPNVQASVTASSAFTTLNPATLETFPVAFEAGECDGHTISSRPADTTALLVVQLAKTTGWLNGNFSCTLDGQSGTPYVTTQASGLGLGVVTFVWSDSQLDGMTFPANLAYTDGIVISASNARYLVLWVKNGSPNADPIREVLIGGTYQGEDNQSQTCSHTGLTQNDRALVFAVSGTDNRTWSSVSGDLTTFFNETETAQANFAFAYGDGVEGTTHTSTISLDLSSTIDKVIQSVILKASEAPSGGTDWTESLAAQTAMTFTAEPLTQADVMTELGAIPMTVTPGELTIIADQTLNTVFVAPAQDALTLTQEDLTVETSGNVTEILDAQTPMSLDQEDIISFAFSPSDTTEVVRHGMGTLMKRMKWRR